MVGGLGQGDAPQGLFQGGVEGGRGRELVCLIGRYSQVVNAPLEQIEPAIGFVGGIGPQLNLKLFGPTL